MKSTGYTANTVKLPKWAKNEHDFVRIQREALESEYAKNKLKSWLDQMFGTRQEDKQKKNIFFCFAYEKYWAIKENRENQECGMVESAIRSISEFMQVPQQIFSQPLDKEKKQLNRSLDNSEDEKNNEGEETKRGGGDDGGGTGTGGGVGGGIMKGGGNILNRIKEFKIKAVA